MSGAEYKASTCARNTTVQRTLVLRARNVALVVHSQPRYGQLIGGS